MENICTGVYICTEREHESTAVCFNQVFAILSQLYASPQVLGCPNELLPSDLPA